MAENVTAFVQRFGLQTALEILGEDVWKYAKFSFEEWDETYRSGLNRDNHAAKAKVLAKMVEAASVTDHWLRIWALKGDGNDLRALVVEKIKERLQLLTSFDQVQKWQPLSFRLDFQDERKELNAVWLQRLAEVAIGFEHWKNIFHEASNPSISDSVLSAHAVCKMVEHARDNGRRWLEVYHAASNDSEAMKKALEYFKKQAETYDDWFDLWYRARDKDNDLAQLAWQKTIDSATTFGQWHRIFSHSKGDDATRERCIGKFIDLATDFHQWLCLYQANESRAKPDKKLRAEALEKMEAKAKNAEDWLRIWHNAPQGDVVKINALMWLKKFVIME